MPIETIHFTKSALVELEPADGRRIYFRDDKVRGLLLSITTNGVKSFSVVKRIGTEVSRISIGRWPDVSIDAARIQAQKIIGKLAEGQNPNAQKRRRRQEEADTPTLDEAFALFKTLPTRTKAKRPRAATTIKE